MANTGQPSGIPGCHPIGSLLGHTSRLGLTRVINYQLWQINQLVVKYPMSYSLSTEIHEWVQYES